MQNPLHIKTLKKSFEIQSNFRFTKPLFNEVFFLNLTFSTIRMEIDLHITKKYILYSEGYFIFVYIQHLNGDVVIVVDV